MIINKIDIINKIVAPSFYNRTSNSNSYIFIGFHICTSYWVVVPERVILEVTCTPITINNTRTLNFFHTFYYSNNHWAPIIIFVSSRLTTQDLPFRANVCTCCDSILLVCWQLDLHCCHLYPLYLSNARNLNPGNRPSGILSHWAPILSELHSIIIDFSYELQWCIEDILIMPVIIDGLPIIRSFSFPAHTCILSHLSLHQESCERIIHCWVCICRLHLVEKYEYSHYHLIDQP